MARLSLARIASMIFSGISSQTFSFGLSSGEQAEASRKSKMLERAHPHPPLSANLLPSLTIKSTSC
jgi:hypothetical protein